MARARRRRTTLHRWLAPLLGAAFVALLAAVSTQRLLPLEEGEGYMAADSVWAKNAETSVHYGGCNEVRALGKAPLYAGQPGYREGMDGDGDGIACEPIR